MFTLEDFVQRLKNVVWPSTVIINSTAGKRGSITFTWSGHILGFLLKSNAACTGYTTYDVSTLGPFLETTEHISGAIEYFANTHTISSFSKCKLVQNVS